MLSRNPYTFDRVVRIIFTVCGTVAALYVLNLLSGVLLPFFVAFLIAYLLEPIVGWNMRLLRVKSRFLPVMLTLIEAICLVGVLTWILVPYLVEESADMAVIIREYASSKIQIPYLSREIHDFIRDNVDFNQISRLLSREQWIELAKESLSQTWSFIGSSLSFIIGLFSWMIVILYVIFIMIDFQSISLSMRRMIPYGQRRQVMQIVGDIKNTMNRYFRGQFLIAASVGLIFAIGFQLIGLPMGVAFGLFIGVLNMVPYLQVISIPIAVLLCLVASISGGPDFWVMCGETAAVYVVAQSVQDLILTPKIMGKAMGLNPAIILLSLSIWGSLLGILGMIIALPLTTLLVSYYKIYVVQRSAPSSSESEEEKV